MVTAEHDVSAAAGRGGAVAAWAALMAAGTAALLVSQVVPAGVPRAILSLPPVLLLPGFAVFTLVAGRSRPRDPAMLTVFSVTLSLAVLMLDALALNAMGVRLSRTSVGLAALLTTGVVMAVAGAAGLEVALPSPAKRSGSTRRTGREAGGWPRPVTAGLALLASVAVAVAVVSLVAAHLPLPAAKPFTSLALGPGWAGSGRAPEVNTGQRLTIPIVATAHDMGPGLYRLTTTVDGIVTGARSLQLPPSGTWSGQASVVTPAGSFLHRVAITLAPIGSTGTAGQDDQVVVYLDNHAR
jgi:uncharacterized membrane protein